VKKTPKTAAPKARKRRTNRGSDPIGLEIDPLDEKAIQAMSQLIEELAKLRKRKG
jgi:RNA processing factor Prp31